jgi:uncharacterized protein YjbI with pentapeptide repeats
MGIRDRRKCLLAGLMLVGGIVLPACDKKNMDTRIRNSAMAKPLSPEELELLSNVGSRRNKHQGARLKIRDRIFGGDLRLDEFEWENIDFEHCDFLNCVMLNGELRNVNFMDCLFLANRWGKGMWEDVSFKDCAWRGPFDMGTPSGVKVLKFDDCEFIGATAEELGYGGKSEYFGSIGGTNGNVLYQGCSFERTFINGGAATKFRGCKMRDVVVYGKDDSSMLLENVTADELVDFGTGLGVYSAIAIKNSKFGGTLTFEGAKIGSAVFEDVQANLDLTLVKANSIVLNRVTFLGSGTPEPEFQYGLTSQSAKIATLTIADCVFQGYGAFLFLSGVEDRTKASGKPLKKGHKNLYSTDIANLSIRNTPVNNGHFKYMNIGNLSLESLSIGTADFSNGRIGKFVTRDVTLTGTIKFDNTIIVEKDSSLAVGTSPDDEGESA